MKNETVFTMPLDQLRKAVARVKNAQEQYRLAIAADLPGLLTMLQQDRHVSDGKFKHGEAEALSSVLDLGDQRPELFSALAAKDGGKDAAKFETAPMRDQLARRNLLASLVDDGGDPIELPITDTVLHLGETVRPLLLAAYHTAKPAAQHDDAIRSVVRPALDFYANIARRSAETRHAKAQTPAK